MSRHVAVMLPGLGGSVLALAGETVWPGTLGEYVLGYGEERFAKLLDDRLAAVDVLRTAHGFTVYEPLLDTLRACGYREAAGAHFELAVFPYDWRRSIAVAARALADRLDAMPGAPDVSLVAHSLGGLVARRYLEAPEYAARPARPRVRLLAAVATPHRGAPSALPAILGARGFHYMKKDQARRLTADPRYPSAYELLPPPREPFIWRGDHGGALAPVALHADPAVATALGLDPGRLAAAAAELAELRADWTATGDAGTPRYFLFAGAQQVTLDHWLARDGTPVPVELPGAGDGRVPFASATLPGLQHQAAAGAHDDLFEDPELTATLARLLPRPAGLAAPPAPPPVRLSLRDTVLRPGEPLRVSVLAAGRALPAGTIRLTHAAQPDGSAGDGPAVEIVIPAMPVRALHLEADAPAALGAWEARFIPASGGVPSPALGLYLINRG